MILLFVIVLFFSHDLFASSNEKDLNEIMKAEYIDLCKNNQKFTPNNYLNYLNEGIKKSDLSQANLWSDKIKHFLTKGIIGAIKLKFIKHDGSDNHKNILSTIDDALIASQKIDLLNVNQAKKSFRADFIFDHAAVALDDLSGNVSSFLSVDSKQNDLDLQKNAYQSYIKRLTTVATATERYLWNTNAENDTLSFLVKSKLKEEQYALLRDQLFDSDYINFLLEDILIEKIKSTEYFWFDSLIEKLYQLQLKYKKGNIEKYKDSDQLVHYGSSGHNNQCGFFSSFCRDVPLEITNVLNNIQIDSCKKEIEEIKVNLNKDKKNVIELIKKLLNNKNLNFQHKKDLQTILGILLASPQVYDARSEYINLVNDLDDEFILKFVLAYTGNGLTGVRRYLDKLNVLYKRDDFDQSKYDKLVEEEKTKSRQIYKGKKQLSDDIRKKYGLLTDDSIPDVGTFDIFLSHLVSNSFVKPDPLNINQLLRRLYDAKKDFPFIDKIIKSDEGKKLGISDEIEQFGNKVSDVIDDLNQKLQAKNLPEIVFGKNEDSIKKKLAYKLSEISEGDEDSAESLTIVEMSGGILDIAANYLNEMLKKKSLPDIILNESKKNIKALVDELSNSLELNQDSATILSTVKKFSENVDNVINKLNSILKANSLVEIAKDKDSIKKKLACNFCDSIQECDKIFVDKLFKDLVSKYKSFFHDMYPKIATKYENFVQKITDELELKAEEYNNRAYYDVARTRLAYMLENNQKLRDFLISDVKKKIIEHFKYHHHYAELTLSPSKVVSNVYNVMEPFGIYCHRNQVNIKAFQDKDTVRMHSITGKGDAGDIFYINAYGGHYEKLVRPLNENQKVWDNLWQHAESLRQILMY